MLRTDIASLTYVLLQHVQVPYLPIYILCIISDVTAGICFITTANAAIIVAAVTWAHLLQNTTMSCRKAVSLS